MAHAISNTRPTAPRRTNAAGRTSLKSAAAHGVAVSRQFWYSSNLPFSACSTWRAIRSSSAFASASDAPGARRASTLNWRTLRGTLAGSPPHGTQRSVPIRINSGGITPTTDAARPLMRIGRFSTPGSPPKRPCQRRWLMIATGGPLGASSAAVKPRPSAGCIPMTGNKSSRSNAVNTRSGTSPPEIFRFPRSNDPTCPKLRAVRMSRYSAGESASTYVVSEDSFGNVTPTETSRPGSGYGNG